MRSPAPSRARAAFTLVELLVVIAIIAILAALTLGAMNGVFAQAYDARAQGEIQALSVALEDYKLENGVYPQATDLATSVEPSGLPYDYVTAGRTLFFALTGTTEFGVAPTEVVYFQPKKSMIATPENSSNTGDQFFMDPWDNAYGYRSLDAGTVQGYNVGFYDIWSTGGGQSNDEDDKLKWIVNWKDPNYDRKQAQ